MNPIRSSPSQNLHENPSKCKFLTRNIQISDEEQMTSRQVRQVYVKGLFIKNLLDKREFCDDGTKDFAWKLIKDRSFKTLRSISLVAVSQAYLHNNLKICKSIKRFHLAHSNDDDDYFGHEQIDIDKLTMIIKKLSRYMKEIHLQDIVPNHDLNPNFYRLAKTILRFPKLQYFERNLQAFGDSVLAQYFQKELEAYNKFASSLSQTKIINFGFSRFEQFDFQELMEKGYVYSGINGLIMNLELDELFQEIYLDIPSDFDDEAHIAKILMKDPNRVNQELMIEHQMIEEVKPFFRFELFPNLKKLDIHQGRDICTLTSFVGDGFQALKSLQELKVCLGSRSANTMHLFNQLFQLPLLRKFSLSLSYIKIEEWALLEQYLKGQENLETFSLCVTSTLYTRSHHVDQNIFLTRIIKSLAHKPQLKSLQLKSPFWSLEALSKGFSYLEMVNQLHTLVIEGSDDIITSDKKSRERVEGLCFFLRSQGKSLKTLKISLLFVLYDQIIYTVARAIATLNQLQELEFIINYHPDYQTDNFVRYFIETLQENMDQKKELTISQTWAPGLAQNLQQLENLGELTLVFRLLGQRQVESLDWFVDFLKTLPKFDKLRKVKIHPKFPVYSRALEEKVTPYLKKVIKFVTKRQSTRSDLMF